MSGRLGRQQAKKLKKALEDHHERQWRAGFPCKVNVDVAASEIRRIISENGGGCTPPQIVESARPEESPLHRAFLWDDEKAGEYYRREQARRLIKSVVVVNRVTNTAHPEFVFIPHERGMMIHPSIEETLPTEASSDGDDIEDVNKPHVSRPRPVRGEYGVLSDVAQDPDKMARAVIEMQSSINSAKRALDEVKQFITASDDDGSGKMAMLLQLGTTLETALELSRRIH